MRSERWSIYSKKYEQQHCSGLVARDEAKLAWATIYKQMCTRSRINLSTNRCKYAQWKDEFALHNAAILFGMFSKKMQFVMIQLCICHPLMVNEAHLIKCIKICGSELFQKQQCHCCEFSFWKSPGLFHVVDMRWWILSFRWKKR